MNKPSQLPVYTKNGVTLAYNPPRARKYNTIKSSSEEKLDQLSNIFLPDKPVNGGKNSGRSLQRFCPSSRASCKVYSSPHHHCCVKNIIHGPDRSCTSSSMPFDLQYKGSNSSLSSNDLIRLSASPTRGRISAIDRQTKRFRDESECRSEPASGLSSPQTSLPRCNSRGLNW